ncbi:hypothetical protein AB4Y43_17090 [Paraburkholderia sp. BR10872]|uniref:hypothetical protein n=1 Tax=Paraburkholderia sp. BR10872 TaxID=3236989 RepID=UPI0034D2C720
MTDIIRFSPAVVFAAEVLSPEWGREHRHGAGTAGSVSRASRTQGDECEPVTHTASEKTGAASVQMALL